LRRVRPAGPAIQTRWGCVSEALRARRVVEVETMGAGGGAWGTVPVARRERSAGNARRGVVSRVIIASLRYLFVQGQRLAAIIPDVPGGRSAAWGGVGALDFIYATLFQ